MGPLVSLDGTLPIINSRRHIVHSFTSLQPGMHLPIPARWVSLSLVFIQQVLITGEMTTAPCFFLQNNDWFMRSKEDIHE